MPGKRSGTIAALLLTAALFCSLPGLWRELMSQSRVAPILQTPRQRTLMVWLCHGGANDRKLLNKAAAAFEKENRGARIFYRRVTADELYGETAVLPDVILFSTGDIAQPQERLIPMAQEYPSAMYAGSCYAVPLWYAPAYLHYPQQWESDPWEMLARPGAVELPKGVALQQWLFTQAGHPQRPGAADGTARVIYTKTEHCIPLTPQTSDQVRYAALCRDGEDAQAFVRLLAGADPSPYGLMRAEQAAILPNAFSHTRQELLALCLDAYRRGEDPAKTLLLLR